MPQADERRESSRWLLRLIKGILLVAVFAVPLLYLPFTPDALLAKVVLIELTAVMAGALWLLRGLIAKRLEYARTPLNVAFLTLAAVGVLATALSASPWTSFWGSDVTGEKTATLIAMIVLSVLAAATFGRRDLIRTSVVLLSSFFLLGLHTLLTILGGRLGLELPAWLAINPVGTVNALGLTLALGFTFGLGLALTAVTSAGRRLLPRSVMLLAVVACLTIFPALVLIGFQTAWLGIGVVMVLMVAANFFRWWRRGDGVREYGLGAVAVGLAFFLVLVSAFFGFWRVGMLANVYQAPLEVSPSFLATVTTGAEVLREPRPLGVGPGNFIIAYNAHRDPVLNSTLFWQVRFNHGFSFLSTLVSTTGAVGLAAFIGFLILVLVLIGRGFWAARESNPYRWALVAGAIFVALEWFLYASNVVLSFLFFLFLGMLSALDREEALGGVLASGEAAGKLSWWRVRRRVVSLETPAVSFLASLVIVFLTAFSLVSLYGLSALYAAEIYFRRGVEALGRGDSIGSIEGALGRAVTLNPTNDSYYQARVQATITAIQQLLVQAAAAPTPEIANEFRARFASGVDAGRTATRLSPRNPQGWFLLGQLYELVMPFEDPAARGAGREALNAYGRAVKPIRPIPSCPLPRDGCT